ncbi:MAG: CHY zinc finger family protein [Hyperionvirus sp.]|uniref:CHY zinc finger family protein n=1 Tax=Hyperionvirus sp. TaxID=2487770 RepID=A0A3G5A976_9VIRU|nr:MAG: CHY zinc finger family protein [Hyperionvirus sp.]
MTKECKHYNNSITLFAACCQKYYDCKRCHNEVNDHVLTGETKIRCDVCLLDQPIAQTCLKCNINLGAYFCEKCIIFENDLNRKLFHCDQCEICRVGGRENFFHCDECSCCLSINIKSDHKCVQQKLKQNCPVCLEYLYTSTIPSHSFACGHPMHVTCLQEYLKQSYKCPTCRKSLFPIDSTFLEQEILATPMPDEYKDKKVNIICNDCGSKSQTSFHIFGHKCQKCNSFNTDQIDYIAEVIGAAAPP